MVTCYFSYIFAASLKSLLPSLDVEQLASTIVGLQQEDA